MKTKSAFYICIYVLCVCIFFVSRVVKSIRGAPAEYGVEDSKLRSLEKMLLTLEGKLMDGKILQVCIVH